MEAPTVESLLASFPIKDRDIATIHGQPDCVTLNALFKAIRRNAASVYSDKGGGKYGHIGITMSHEAYTTLQHGTEFNLQPHPGVLTFQDSEKTVIQREDARDLYNRKRYIHLVEQNLTLALKNIVMSKLQEATYIGLCDEYVHYENVTIWELMHHLETRYGEKTTAMLTENITAMQADFDISQPSIEGLFVRQNRLQQFAHGTAQAISDGFWVLYTINVIDKSGLLHKGVQKWEAQDSAYKTPKNLTTDFMKYHDSYLKKRDNDDGDHGSAFSVQTMQQALQQQQEEFRNFRNQTNAQSNLQTERINQLLNSRDAHVPDEIAPRMSEVETLRSANAALQAQLSDRNTSTNNTRTHRVERVKFVCGNRDRRKSRPDDNRTEKRFSNTNYCHTHGFDVSTAHDSKTCEYPDKYHDFTATKSNTKDGCQIYKRLA